MKDIKYRFYPNTSGKTVSKIKFIDKLLYTLWRGTEKKFTEQTINKITIIQLAHIGDMILLLPALKTLKCNTNYHINLLVNSQNFNIAIRLKYVDSVTVADEPYFARNNKTSY
jgi:heptosyltransferase-2